MRSDLMKGRQSPVRRPGNELTRLEDQTLMRAAHVQAEQMLAREKMARIDQLVQASMVSHTVLSHLAQQLAGDNLLMYEDLRHEMKLARLARAEVLADLLDRYQDES